MKSSRFCIALIVSLAGALAVCPAGLNAQAPSNPPGSQAPNPPPAQQKVWTNDDIDHLRDSGSGGVSVIGNSPAPAPDATPASKGASTPAKPATTPKLPKEKDPDWYRAQLAPLYKSLDLITDQIAAAQSAADGESRGDAGVSLNVRAPAGTAQQQIVQLQKEQTDVQAKIDALLDMARHNDIPPGDLR